MKPGWWRTSTSSDVKQEPLTVAEVVRAVEDIRAQVCPPPPPDVVINPDTWVELCARVPPSNQGLYGTRAGFRGFFVSMGSVTVFCHERVPRGMVLEGEVQEIMEYLEAGGDPAAWRKWLVEGTICGEGPLPGEK